MFRQYLHCTWQLHRHGLLQWHRPPKGNLCYSLKAPVLWASAIKTARHENSVCGGKRGHLNRCDAPLRGGSVALCWRQEKVQTRRAAGKCQVEELCKSTQHWWGSKIQHRWEHPWRPSVHSTPHPGHTQPHACVMAQWRWDLREDWVDVGINVSCPFWVPRLAPMRTSRCPGLQGLCLASKTSKEQ